MKDNSLVPATVERVSRHTSAKVNQKIFDKTVKRLDEIGTDHAKIEARLRELDREWDIERAIEVNASSILLVSLALGTRNRRWFNVTGMVASFLFQHAIQGWCPPVPILRRLGFRTQREIDDERTILLSRLGIPTVNANSKEALNAMKH